MTDEQYVCDVDACNNVATGVTGDWYTCRPCAAAWTGSERMKARAVRKPQDQPVGAPGLLQGPSDDRPLGTGAANPGEPGTTQAEAEALKARVRADAEARATLNEIERACKAAGWDSADCSLQWFIASLIEPDTEHPRIRDAIAARDRWANRVKEVEAHLEAVRDVAGANTSEAQWNALKEQTRLAKLAKRAVKRWGTQSQLRKVVEECAELIAALYHHADGKIATDALADEVADVAIVVTQAVLILGADADAALHRKMDKLEALLDAEGGE